MVYYLSRLIIRQWNNTSELDKYVFKQIHVDNLILHYDDVDVVAAAADDDDVLR